jgi:hypothetical protein
MIRSGLTTGIAGLLRLPSAGIGPWDAACRSRSLPIFVGIIIIGAGAYGAVVGAWREPLQAVYTAIKLPLVILLTTLGNTLINAMLAPLLGVQLNLRQSFAAVLFTFAIAASLLGSLVPVAAFVVWNLPPLSASTQLGSMEYGLLQLLLATFIAGCGIAGNVLLLPALETHCGSRQTARRVLLAWLLVNLLLGSQVSWLLRPFIWDPARPVEFIGPEYLRGSFFETVFEAVRQLILHHLPVRHP